MITAVSTPEMSIDHSTDQHSPFGVSNRQRLTWYQEYGRVTFPTCRRFCSGALPEPAPQHAGVELHGFLGLTS